MVATQMGEQRTSGVQIPPGRFRALYERSGWTQQKLARVIGVSPRQVARYIADDQQPKRGVWAHLCSTLGVEAVFEGDEPERADWRPPPT